MSGIGDPSDYGYDNDEFTVTSPTSLNRLESVRRTNSGFPTTGAKVERMSTVYNESLSRSNSRDSLSSRKTIQISTFGNRSGTGRAPPPPPPIGIHSNENISSIANIPRTRSNPNMVAGMPTSPTSMHSNTGYQPVISIHQNSHVYAQHGQSLGPSAFVNLNQHQVTSPTHNQGTVRESPREYSRESSKESSRESSTTKSFAFNKSFAGFKPRKSFLSSVLSRDKSEQSYHQDSMPEEISCEGYLTKRGHVITNWKTRYFVLRGHIIEYFSSEDKTKKCGSVFVEKVAPWTGESHGFMFFTSTQIPYYVYASSEEEREKWLTAFKDIYVEQEDATCEGYLTKRGNLVPSQRMVYYVLHGMRLRHYPDQQAYRENQSSTGDVEIRSVSPWEGQANGLVFQTVTGNIFYVTADTAAEQAKWLGCLSGLKQSKGLGSSTMQSSLSSSQLSAMASQPIVCAGYLTKQGHKRKSWKKRYFILRGNVISYYADYDPANNLAKGKALGEVAVEDVQRWDGEPFGFMFMTVEQVAYYVYADNERERTKWVTALRRLTTVPEEPEIEKKRCPNCTAVLTGSRFCGACGFNLRGTQRNERKSIGNRRAEAGIDSAMQNDDDDEETRLYEYEALSEGARMLLLAVMQTPEGVDIGDDGEHENRGSVLSNKDDTWRRNESPDHGTTETSHIHKDINPFENEVQKINSEIDDEITDALTKTSFYNNDQFSESNDVDEHEQNWNYNNDTKYTAVDKSPVKKRLEPTFDIIENERQRASSFHSFEASDEEDYRPQEQAQPKHVQTGLSMVVGRNISRTTRIHSDETSSDEDEMIPPRQTTIPYQLDGEAKDEIERFMESEVKNEAPGSTTRRSSIDSLGELDTHGIAAFNTPSRVSDAQVNGRTSQVANNSKMKNDLYHSMERELDFTPLFIPSADSPVRCRLYSSLSYASAKNVVLFFPDSGPLGLWHQDSKDTEIAVDNRWSMMSYLSRAQDEGYGILLSNPFTNSAIVYEAGGFQRSVPIPQSSTPKEHALFVWQHFASACKGMVSIIAYGRGGILVKNVLEAHEDTARSKLHRIVFIDSKHEIDDTETPGVLELLGRRSINWEASFEPLGAQIVDSQPRVGCVCLSLGQLPVTTTTGGASPQVLKKAEDAAFAFVGANPEKPGMTAVVKHVRAELRKRKLAPKSGLGSEYIDNKDARKSNILVLGEADTLENDTSDTSTGDTEEDAQQQTNNPPPSYYLPKRKSPPSNRLHAQDSSNGQPNVQSGSGNKQRYQISVKDFELQKVVGQGGFGKVFLARKLTTPNQNECFAMKVLKKQHVVSSGLVNTTMAERRILTEISHPFVVKLHYAFQSDTKLYLVMDYLSGGSLAFHLRRRRKFPESWAKFYAAEVSAAMAHLHSVNIIYRDAKLENVLMDHEGHVRITDFGLSKVGVSGLKGATTFCGTAAYIAPELLKGKTYGKAADWWSFGILLYEMIGGKPPYYHRNRDIMFQTILKQEWVTFSPDFSDEAVSLIRGLLTRDPSRRLGSGELGADEVLTHPFFDSINWRDLLEKKITPPFNPGVGKLDTHYAPRHMNPITAHDREGSFAPGLQLPGEVRRPGKAGHDFDGFSFIGRPPSSFKSK